MIEFTVSTFNGLTIKGIGYTISEAKAEARQKCEAMGTLPKHIVSILESLINTGSSGSPQT